MTIFDMVGVNHKSPFFFDKLIDSDSFVKQNALFFMMLFFCGGHEPRKPLENFLKDPSGFTVVILSSKFSMYLKLQQKTTIDLVKL